VNVEGRTGVGLLGTLLPLKAKLMTYELVLVGPLTPPGRLIQPQ
jgi:hypothetical protein